MSQSVETTLRRAAALAAKGQAVAAAEACALVLARHPGNARARALLAEIDRKGHAAVPAPVIVRLRGLLAARAWSELGAALRLLPEAAGGVGEVQLLLAQAHLAQGRAAEAAGAARLAVLLRPGEVAGWMVLGNAAFLGRDMAGAVSAFAEAGKIAPDDADVLNNLGMAQAGAGEMAAALATFARAARLAPGAARIAYNRANALRDAGQHGAAIEEYRRALALDGGHATAANNLGTLLHQIGRNAEAEAAYRQAVEARPDYAQAHRNLSAVHRYGAGDPLLTVLEARLAVTEEGRDRMYLLFARAKAHEDMGEDAAAFDCLVAANALRRRLLNYDPAVDRLLFERLHGMFAQPLPPVAVAAEARPRPVFVLGMMRSGTTLVEQILSSHSAVQGAGELETLGRLCLPVMERFHATGVVPGEGGLAALRAAYLEELGRHAAGRDVVTDKMPVNFRWIGFIMAALPEARVIHLRRDPVATCWSIFRNYFSGEGNGYACDLGDVAAYWHLYDGLMARWHRLFPGRIMDVPYEALTQEPEGWTRRILEHVGLEWEAACLAPERNERAVMTASAAQVRQAIYRGSSDAWRRHEARLAPLVQALASSP